MRVYYFTKPGYGLEAIQRRRLKLARISALNDPFEFLQVASRNPKTRARYQYVKRALSEYMGLLCFSENWRNPVQWGHYADSHRGICLGFDVAPAAGLRKVRYVKSRIRPNLRAMKAMSKAAVEHMLDLLTLKFEHWQYEQEHRLFVQLNDKDEQSGLYFFDFGDSEEVRLREVIVGAQSEISPEQVAKVLGDIAPQVVSRKARLAFRTFEVVKQRRQDLWRPSRRRVGLREPSFEALVDHALRVEDFSTARSLVEPEAKKKSTQSQTDELIGSYAVAGRVPSADSRSKKVTKRNEPKRVRKKK